MKDFSYSVREYDIVSYDEQWPIRFKAIQQKLKAIFRDDAVAIEHIGSTSVPGMEGKSIIDALIVLAEQADLDSHRKEMEKAEYVYQGQMVTDGSRLYRETEGNNILANIHVFHVTHPHVNQLLGFRDYLRAHPEAVAEYSAIKRELLRKYPNDYAAYRKEKDVFLNDLKKRAGIETT